jgi:hypothetical protein
MMGEEAASRFSKVFPHGFAAQEEFYAEKHSIALNSLNRPKLSLYCTDSRHTCSIAGETAGVDGICFIGRRARSRMVPRQVFMIAHQFLAYRQTETVASRLARSICAVRRDP